MSNSCPLNNPYRIANLIVNPQLTTVQYDGTNEPVRLEAKVMQLLTFLVKNYGKICTKQDIINEIWPHQIISDEAVTRLIFVLRSVLLDDAKSPVFISTIPKKGYVFLVKAEQLPSNNKKAITTILVCSILLVFLYIGVYWKNEEQIIYQIERSSPVTHQEGREYDLAFGNDISGYFHQYKNLTKLIISEEKSRQKVLVEDHWQKRSLHIINNNFFYIRYIYDQFQIIHQTLDGAIDILYESSTPIYSLSVDKQTQSLFFNKLEDNEHTKFYKYSFMGKQVEQLAFFDLLMPSKVYSHFYHTTLEQLFFVGIEGRKPTIYGLNKNNNAYEYKINGFDSISYLAKGKKDQDILVVGTYKLTQGIWSVSLNSSSISLITSHPDNNITQVQYNAKTNTLFYSFQGQRVDLKEINFLGKMDYLPKLNSTLVDNNARYSSDGQNLYFASDRGGNFELYQYKIGNASTHKVSQIKATKIWHYSISNDQSKIAVVYSTDHIRLGVIDLTTRSLLNSTPLEEIKFPLSWSKNDEKIYVSEHRSNIALYVYDTKQLTIEAKRNHLGLTAAELSPNKVLAFDYQTKQFVTYDFSSGKSVAMSEPTTDYASLAPNNTYSNGNIAMLLYSDGMRKTIYRIQLSTAQEKRKHTLVANVLQTGTMQAFSPDMSSILLAGKDESLNGNIIALQLK